MSESDLVAAAGESVNADGPDIINEGPSPDGMVDRPEWLDERFETPQALAESYAQLEAKMKTKTEDMREDIRTSLLGEIEQSAAEGIPSDASGYELPEEFRQEEGQSTELLENFREWAFERELGQDDFNELVSFYAEQFLPDIEAESEKLGENANQRLNDLNRWIGANVEEQYYPALQNIMTTAQNVEAIEAIMKLTIPSSMPGQTQSAAPVQATKTREEILQLMSSPQYMDNINRDPSVVAEVDKWFSENS